LRKAFQNQQHIHFRIASLKKVETKNQAIHTDIGQLKYDYLVLAIGADTNYFGNQNIKRHATPMKSLGEAIDLRNTILTKSIKFCHCWWWSYGNRVGRCFGRNEKIHLTKRLSRVGF